MKVTEVSVEYSRTANLGNYESERVQVGLASAVAEGEDHRRLVEELALEAEEAALNQLQRLTNQRQAERHRRYRIAEAGEPEDDDSDPETTRRMGDD